MNQPLGAQHSLQPLHGAAYSPYQMYAHQRRTPIMNYSYIDSDFSSNVTKNDYCSPQAQGLFDRLIQELNGSINDYEVIVLKLRDQGY